MKTNRYLAALVLLVCAPLALAAQKVSFASGKATVPLPENFRVSTAGDDLVAIFGADGDHKLELTLLKDLSNAEGAKNRAVEFVEAQAEKKGLKILRSEGRATLMEAGAQEQRGGKTYQSVHWQIAVGNCLFTMTVTAPVPMSKELDAFLGDPLVAISNELACKAN